MKTRTPLRFALIGAGMVAEAHLKALAESPDAEAVVLYSRTEQRARALAAKWRIPWTTSLDQALRDPAADAALILTAPWVHGEHALRAMELGKHVLVEKPMDVELKRCDEMIRAAGKYRRKLGVILQNRFKKGVCRTREFIQSGRLGEMIHISGYVKWYRPQSYYEANDWRGRTATEGGGVIFSQAGHTLDLMLHLMGPVKWVFANMVTAPVHRGIEIENLGVVSFRFRNGATGVLEAATALYPGTPERLEVHGARGTIELVGGQVKRWDILNPGPNDAPGDIEEVCGTGASDPMAFPHLWHRMQIEDFCAAIREDRPPAVDGEEGRKLNVMARYVYESARQHAPVELPSGCAARQGGA